MADETTIKKEENFESEKSGMGVFKESPKVDSELKFHSHTGTDGSPKIDDKNVINRVGSGKYLSTVKKTTQFTTASTSFVDVTDLSLTVTTGNTRVLLMFNADAYHTATGGEIYLTITVDGTKVGGTNGMGRMIFDQTNTNTWQLVSLHYITDVLTAGSHTFTVQMRTSGADGYLNFDSSTSVFSAIELST